MPVGGNRVHLLHGKGSLKNLLFQPTLANDGSQRTRFQIFVQGNRDRNGSMLKGLPHDPMAPLLANRNKPMFFQKSTHFGARESLTRGHNPSQTG